MNMQPEPSRRLTKILLLLACVALMVPLLVYAYTGTFSRHRADDFCHSGDIIEHGFWQAQVVVYLNSSDRYSVEPLVGINEMFGRGSIRVLPAIAILLWLAATFWALKHLAHWMRLPLNTPAVFLLSQILVFFTLFESPNLFQSLYWRAGMLTYLMPLVVDTFLAGTIIRQLDSTGSKKISSGSLLWIALLAFFAAGFSETSAAMQAGALMLVAVIPAWQALRSRRMSPALSLLAAALVGTLLGMLVLFLSPAAHLRQSNFDSPPDLPTLILLSLRFGVDFIIWDTLKVLPLPVLVSAAMAALLIPAGSAGMDMTAKWSLRTLLTGLVLVLLVCVLLSVCCVAPSVYVYRAGMEPRAAITARWVTVLSTIALGSLVGLAFGQLLRRATPTVQKFITLLAAVLLLLGCIYPLRAAMQAAAAIPEYRSRAEAWDQRDATIRRDLANDILDIETVELDSIGKIGDLKDDPDLWVNVCAARYYGARTVRAFVPE